MTADTVGGVWTYALDLSRALRSRGVEVLLATMGTRLSAAQWETARGIPGLAVRESEYRLEWMESPWADVAAAGEWLLELEAEWSPDVVHLNGYAHAALPWKRKPLVVAHSCVRSWWRAVWGEVAPERYRRYRQEVERGLRAAGVVVAPTRAMLQALEQEYAFEVPTEVIFNGRSAPNHLSPVAKEPFIFAAGRLWDEAKNLAALEAVAPRLGWPVRVAGDADHPERGPAAVWHVQALGRLEPEAVEAWMARASVYALPARYEPFGLSVLEAALAGCALVLGDIPSLRELWAGAAIFVPPDRPEVLERVLKRLTLNPWERAFYAARGRARAATFSVGAMVDGYLEIYEELCSVQPERWSGGPKPKAPREHAGLSSSRRSARDERV